MVFLHDAKQHHPKVVKCGSYVMLKEKQIPLDLTLFSA